ncbi:hypothetical protein KKF11_02800, partial [Patescibacteria group bacterium]|nr:hypothetical protein [Patescibacteria group bacterium]
VPAVFFLGLVLGESVVGDPTPFWILFFLFLLISLFVILNEEIQALISIVKGMFGKIYHILMRKLLRMKNTP